MRTCKMIKSTFLLTLIIFPAILLAQPDVEPVPDEIPVPNPENLVLSYDLEIPPINYLSAPPTISAVYPAYSAVPPEVISYVVPLLNYSYGPSGGAVARNVTPAAQLGCGIFYKYDYKRAKLFHLFTQENKMGLIKGSDTVVPASWDTIIPLYPDRTKIYIVKKGNYYGVLTENNFQLYKPIYDSITSVSEEQYQCIHHLEMFKFHKNGKQGIGSADGRWKVKLKDEKISLLYNRWHCPANHALFAVEKNGLFGMRNKVDSLLIPIEFDSIISFKELQLPVTSYYNPGREYIMHARKGDSLFVFNNQRIIHRSKYEKVEPLYGESSYSIYKFKLNDKWGIARKGKTIAANIYDDIRPGSDETRCYYVEKDSLVGVLGPEGEVLVPVQYQSVEKVGLNCYVASSDRNVVIYNSKGVKKAQDSLIGFKYYDENRAIIQDSNGWGLYDVQNNKVLTELIYDYPKHLFDLHGNGIASSNQWHISLALKGLYNCMDLNGDIMMPNESLVPVKMFWPNREFIYFEAKTNDSIIHYHGDGTRFSYPINESIDYRYWTKNLVKVAKNKKLGLRNRQGVLILPLEYDRVFVLMDKVDSNKVYASFKDSTLSFYKNGKLIQQLKVDDAVQMAVNKIRIRKGNLFGVVEIDGTITVEPKLQVINVFSNGYKIARNEDYKLCYYDSLNNKVDSTVFDYAGVIDKKTMRIIKSNRNGIYSIKGEEIIPIEFQKIKIYDSIYACKKANRYAIYNKKGKRLTDFKFKKVKYQYKHAICVKSGYYFGIIDFEGNYILEPISRAKIDLEKVFRSGRFPINTTNGLRYLDKEFKLIP